ncbi:MAG: hypothetical protein LBO05_04515 [Deltaproteobacteria bacterium]|nr:hypothetical protein [Deltaproteobacteria bacterium]
MASRTKLAASRLVMPEMSPAGLAVSRAELVQVKTGGPKPEGARAAQAKSREVMLEEIEAAQAKLKEAKAARAKLEEAKAARAKLEEAKAAQAKLEEAKAARAKLEEAKAARAASDEIVAVRAEIKAVRAEMAEFKSARVEMAEIRETLVKLTASIPDRTESAEIRETLVKLTASIPDRTESAEIRETLVKLTESVVALAKAVSREAGPSAASEATEMTTGESPAVVETAKDAEPSGLGDVVAAAAGPGDPDSGEAWAPGCYNPAELARQARKLLGDREIYDGRVCSEQVILGFWRFGRLVLDRVFGFGKTDRAVVGMGVLSEILTKSHGPQFHRKNIRRMIEFARLAPDVGQAVGHAKSLSWKKIWCLLRAGTPGKFRSLAARAAAKKLDLDQVARMVRDSVIRSGGGGARVQGSARSAGA